MLKFELNLKGLTLTLTPTLVLENFETGKNFVIGEDVGVKTSILKTSFIKRKVSRNSTSNHARCQNNFLLIMKNMIIIG